MSNNVIPIIVKNSGCSYHRIELPYLKLGYTVTENYTLNNNNLYIINRKFPKHSIEEVVRSRIKYILDLDDYWEMHESHPMYKRHIDSNTKETILSYIKHSSCVTVTNIKLYNLVKPHNKNVHIIPNAIPFGQDQFTSNQKITDKVRFVYAGSFSHLEDIKIISPVINNIDVDFTLASKLPSSEDWTQMRNVFTGNINTEPNRGVNNYMNVYDGKSVSLVPLVNETFSECKSNLKILEAGCKGLHMIASKTLPYYNYLDREYIDFADNDYEWYELIKKCRFDKSYVTEKGLILQEHVKKHYHLSDINEYRKDLLEYESKKG